MVRRIADSLSRCGLSLGLLCGVASPGGVEAAEPDARAAEAGAQAAGTAAGALFDFDIPAQPLEQALYQYGDISHQPALFPSALTAALTSTAVHGRYPADAALRQLLQGTGLEAYKTNSAQGDVFLLRRARVAAGVPARRGSNLDGDPARVQAGVMRALCSDARTAPGGYRALFRVRVDADGQVRGVALVDSTGDADRDAALQAVLRRASVGSLPSSSRAEDASNGVADHVAGKAANHIAAYTGDSAADNKVNPSAADYTMALLPTRPGAAPPCARYAGGAP